MRAWAAAFVDGELEGDCYSFGGDVACMHDDYYHDVGGCAKEQAENDDAGGAKKWFHNGKEDCGCRACHARWLQADMKVRSEKVAKAVRCDEAYHTALRRLFGACVQRAVDDPNDRSRGQTDLKKLIAVVVPVLPLCTIVDIGLMMVRANCPDALKRLSEVWEPDSAGNDDGDDEDEEETNELPPHVFDLHDTKRPLAVLCLVVCRARPLLNCARGDAYATHADRASPVFWERARRITSHLGAHQ